MLRYKIDELREWKNKEGKKPMLLIGPRQVGKTYICNEFAKEFSESIYINLEAEEDIIELFNKTINPIDIKKYISLKYGKVIDSNLLLVFDEIQISNRAITSLKYFYEQMPELNILCAGSLLGTMINREKFSFPVGKVDFSYVHPMTFNEFLIACGKMMNVGNIVESFNSRIPLGEIHTYYHKILLEYLCVGGMPEAVKNYVENDCDITKFDRKIHQNILNSYIADMSKYATNLESVKIQQIYKNNHNNLKTNNTKFKYSNIKKSAKSSEFESSIDWLLISNLNIKVDQINNIETPLKAFVNDKGFKLFFSDVGLLNKLVDIPFNTILNDHDYQYKGALIENFVAQHLKIKYENLFYFTKNTYEIDFVIQDDLPIVIEVKGGKNSRAKSLMYVLNNYKKIKPYKVCNEDFKFNGNYDTIPLYAIELL